MSFENRNQFLENVKNDLVFPNIDKIVYLLEKAVKTNNKSLVKYNNIIKIGTTQEKHHLDTKKYEKLLEKVYRYWWKNTVLPLFNTTTKEWQKQGLRKLIEDPALNPEGREKIDNIFEIWTELDDEWVAGLKTPIYFQEKYFCHFSTNLMSVSRMKFEKQFKMELIKQ